MKPVKRNPMEILSEHQKRSELLKTSGAQHKEVQPLQIQEVMYIRAILHPTDKQASKDMTRELIKFICDKGIITAQDIFDKFKWSNKPVLQRLKRFREFGLVKRESKRYYMPTPRMLELRNKYLERVCG